MSISISHVLCAGIKVHIDGDYTEMYLDVIVIKIVI